ncbi:unnamed protein product [Lactuca saligna]|uniref:Charged multivesicular body protein 2a n=2 Tax=Magnoliopsida TaxID=3398 RepID=A0AA35Z6A7_LACSI|nr:unnamed protein product [Lactuca saligna]
MSFLFGKKKTPAELLRENKRMLDKSIREIERERQGLQTQEKKLIVEIKKSAKQGQMGAVKVMAKDLIRTRHQIEKFYKLKSQLQGVSLRIQTLKSTQAMGEAMKGVTKAMGQMNRQMNLPSLQKIMQEFERQNEKMEMVSEVMGDAIDDALEGDEEEDETEELVSQVLDEIGIDINQELMNAPSGAVSVPAAKTKVAQAEAPAGAGDDGGIDSDLQARSPPSIGLRSPSFIRPPSPSCTDASQTRHKASSFSTYRQCCRRSEHEADTRSSTPSAPLMARFMFDFFPPAHVPGKKQPLSLRPDNVAGEAGMKQSLEPNMTRQT